MQHCVRLHLHSYIQFPCANSCSCCAFLLSNCNRLTRPSTASLLKRRLSLKRML